MKVRAYRSKALQIYVVFPQNLTDMLKPVFHFRRIVRKRIDEHTQIKLRYFQDDLQIEINISSVSLLGSYVRTN